MHIYYFCTAKFLFLVSQTHAFGKVFFSYILTHIRLSVFSTLHAQSDITHIHLTYITEEHSPINDYDSFACGSVNEPCQKSGVVNSVKFKITML